MKKKFKMGNEKCWWINFGLSIIITLMVWVLDVNGIFNYNFTQTEMAIISFLIWMLLNQSSIFKILNEK